jgi:hypothetical protein
LLARILDVDEAEKKRSRQGELRVISSSAESLARTTSAQNRP